MNDYYWLNKDSEIFLKRDGGYLKEGVEPKDRLKEIADNAEEILGIEGFSDKFMGYVAKGYYSLATPVWINFGNKRGLPVSCFGSYISDEMREILGKTVEVGMMTKYGGGTSGYFGDLRPQGTPIKDNGKANGPVHYLELYDKTSEIVTQGSARRGFFAAYLSVDHPDILEFLKIRDEGNSIQNLAFGVTVTDKWMEEMEAGDKSKRKIWSTIIKKRYESGFPYISFIDNMNNNAPQAYKDKNLKIKASNLCLVGETKIEISLYEDGRDSTEITLEDFNFQFNNGIWEKVFVKSYENDEVVWSEITVSAKTGETDELIEIETEKGNIIRCTPEHKIYTKNRGYVEAQHLKEDDVLVEE
jgi:ribonucleoside-diphosphate reductase alpha chain